MDSRDELTDCNAPCLTLACYDLLTTAGLSDNVSPAKVLTPMFLDHCDSQVPSGPLTPEICREAPIQLVKSQQNQPKFVKRDMESRKGSLIEYLPNFTF